MRDLPSSPPMSTPAREEVISQFTDLLTRVSDEKALKFLKSIYNLYHNFPQERFTLENLTHREKTDMYHFSATAVINVIRRLRSRRDLSFFQNISAEREVLSGLVFLRIEMIPICHEIIQPLFDPLRKWIEKSIDIEAVLKRVIWENYENGKYQGNNDEGPIDHYWWSARRMNDEEKRFSDLRWNEIDQLDLAVRDEYNLTD